MSIGLLHYGDPRLLCQIFGQGFSYTTCTYGATDIDGCRRVHGSLLGKASVSDAEGGLNGGEALTLLMDDLRK